MSDLITVLGDSHVRSLAGVPSLLPLFVGPGREANFTSLPAAKRTRAILARNLARLADDEPVVLVFGEPDVRLTLEQTGAPELGAAIDDSADRLLDAAVEIGETRPTLLLGSPPRPDIEHNRWARRYNERVRAGCARAGLAFVDLWPEIFDEARGLVRPEYEGDHIHLSHKLAPLVVRALAEHGWLPTSVEADAYVPWRYRYRLALSGSETRIWGDDSRSSKAALFARSDHLEAATREVLLPVLRCLRSPSLCVRQGAEGFVAWLIPRGRTSAIAVSEAEDVARRRACRLRGFLRRDDVAITDRSDEEPADIVFEPEPTGRGPSAPRPWPRRLWLAQASAPAAPRPSPQSGFPFGGRVPGTRVSWAARDVEAAGWLVTLGLLPSQARRRLGAG